MLSEMFGPTAAENQTAWTRSPDNPILRGDSGAWSRDFIAMCSIVEHDGELRLYAEGSAGAREQIGLFTSPADQLEGPWTPSLANPVLRVGADGFDRGGVFDPSVVRFGSRWLMYFSAVEGDAHEYAEQLAHGTATGGPVGETIGLAFSDDGVAFEKYSGNPVLHARCPFAMVHDNLVHLFYVQVADGGYQIHLAVSEDGINFRPVRTEPVLDIGVPGSWDSYSVTTPKVFRDGDRFYLAYAGDNTSLDDPTGIGLAVSDDLVQWEKIAGNPVFVAGAAGAFDSVSVASPIIRRVGDRYAMVYAGSDRTVGEGLHSQVGLAWLPARC